MKTSIILFVLALIVKITDTGIWLQDDNPASAEELRFGR
jgi:hypothetical protein